MTPDEQMSAARAALNDWECRDRSPDDIELNLAAVALSQILDLHTLQDYGEGTFCEICQSRAEPDTDVWPCPTSAHILSAILGGDQ